MKGRSSHGRTGLLLICRYEPNAVSIASETIAWLQRLSRFPITVLNMVEHTVAADSAQLASAVDLDAFAGIILHETITHNVRTLRNLDQHTRRKLKDYAGVKVIMRREDGRDNRAIAAHMAETRYDILLTALPSEGVARLYSAEALGGARVQRVLPGYVTPTLRAIDPRKANRPIDIGYRGSIHATELEAITRAACGVRRATLQRFVGQGLILDIANRREDRFDGDTWYRYLETCKATLGSQAGARLFDLDGRLAEHLAALDAELGSPRNDAGHLQAYLDRLAALPGWIDARQIAPAQFEAAACGTLQVLEPGNYSGVLVPGRHFVPIEHDGGASAALEILRDAGRRTEIVDAARSEVILNSAHWIEAFVDQLDRWIEEAGTAKGSFAAPRVAYRNVDRQVLLLCGAEPRHDPRHGWTERHAPADILIHQLGVVESDQMPIHRTSTRGGLYWAVPRLEWVDGTALRWFSRQGTSAAAATILHELTFLERAYKLPADAFADLFGAPRHAARLGSLRFYIRVLLATTITLVEAGARLRGVQAIIASDVYALPAAILLKEFFGVEVLYDAHEYMPEVLPEANEFERQFFAGLESRLVAHTVARQTVTPGLAALMTAEYGLPFDVVVNAEPNEDERFEALERPASAPCIFLFCGLFGSGRGLDVLVETWPDMPPNAVLHLQGPDNALKRELIARAEANGLLGTHILFPEAVPEDEIVASMRAADVGLIPYEPISTNHRHCCPNKLSQYMRAGLPILANDTNFVGSVIREAECGQVADFRDHAQLVAAVTTLTDDAGLRRQRGLKGRAYFEASFNWQARSQIIMPAGRG